MPVARQPHEQFDVANGDTVFWPKEPNDLWRVVSTHYLLDAGELGNLPAASIVAKADVDLCATEKRTRVAALAELRVVEDAEWWIHKSAVAGRKILA